MKLKNLCLTFYFKNLINMTFSLQKTQETENLLLKKKADDYQCASVSAVSGDSSSSDDNNPTPTSTHDDGYHTEGLSFFPNNYHLAYCIHKYNFFIKFRFDNYSTICL